MSEDAQQQVKDAIERWNEVENLRSQFEIQEGALAVMCIALQQAGIIPLHTETSWMISAIRSIPEEASLRSKALMKGESPRN